MTQSNCNLIEKSCIPCRGGTPALSKAESQVLLAELQHLELETSAEKNKSWKIEKNHHLLKEYHFSNFLQALQRVNEIGKIAEQESHHPELQFSWGYLKVKVWTHKIEGLTENDFILAAKIEELNLS